MVWVCCWQTAPSPAAHGWPGLAQRRLVNVTLPMVGVETVMVEVRYGHTEPEHSEPSAVGSHAPPDSSGADAADGVERSFISRADGGGAGDGDGSAAVRRLSSWMEAAEAGRMCRRTEHEETGAKPAVMSSSSSGLGTGAPMAAALTTDSLSARSVH